MTFRRHHYRPHRGTTVLAAVASSVPHVFVFVGSHHVFVFSFILIGCSGLVACFGGCTFKDEGKHDKSVNFVQTVGWTFVLSLLSLFTCWGLLGGWWGFR